jgi:hypothetical protein
VGILQTRAVRDRGAEVKSGPETGLNLAAVPALIAFLFNALNYLFVRRLQNDIGGCYIGTYAEHCSTGRHGLLGVHILYSPPTPPH